MNRRLRRELFIGFRSTPILATLIFILGLCMALDYFVEPNDDVSLICHADVYEAKDSRFSTGGLKLDINRVGNQIEFQIVFIKQGTEQAHVTTLGELTEVSSPILTYKIDLQDAYLKHGVFLNKISQHMDEMVGSVQKLIDNDENSGKPFYIKVLEMDKSLGFVTIQFNERNALWVCEIQ
ncbi:hypothetical protein L2755_20005 [Shewanella abyssi]|uniref:hypothetical protein n=1 Tax=Shewanella abyssi TaxID=311789 RepID=UPI00200EE6DA|nr:hypothetical protein [Shewanella abyssi]MCL1051891.1 hypothetical protein [Shewanella abyssi]